MTPVPPHQSAERQLDASAPETIGLVRSPLGLGWRLWNKHEDFYEDADTTVKYVRASDLTRLNAKVVEQAAEIERLKITISAANSAIKMLGEALEKADRADTARLVEIADLSARLARAEEVMRPFSIMAGEIFARNKNKPDVILEFNNPDEALTADDFFAVRAFLSEQENPHG